MNNRLISYKLCNRWNTACGRKKLIPSTSSLVDEIRVHLTRVSPHQKYFIICIAYANVHRWLVEGEKGMIERRWDIRAYLLHVFLKDVIDICRKWVEQLQGLGLLKETDSRCHQTVNCILTLHLKMKSWC